MLVIHDLFDREASREEGKLPYKLPSKEEGLVAGVIELKAYLVKIAGEYHTFS